MAAGKVDLIIPQGEDYEKVFQLKDSAGVAIDLTGDSFAGKIRANTAEGSVIGTFTATIPDPITGTVKLFMAKADTSAMAAGHHVYDLERTLAGSGYVKRVLEGRVQVTREVTR